MRPFQSRNNYKVTTLGGAPVSLSDGNQTLDNATHSGYRILLVPDSSQDNTYTSATGSYSWFCF